MIRALSVGTPAAGIAAAAHLIPWQAAIIPASLYAFAYICRIVLRHKRDCKAIDKARAADIPALMTALTIPDTPPRLPHGRPPQDRASPGSPTDTCEIRAD